MKHFLIITISALKAAAMMSRKAYQAFVAEPSVPEETTATPMPGTEPGTSDSHKEEVIPMQDESVPEEMPQNVVDFQAARNRILDQRARDLGVI
jgi:hypothetical protein